MIQRRTRPLTAKKRAQLFMWAAHRIQHPRSVEEFVAADFIMRKYGPRYPEIRRSR